MKKESISKATIKTLLECATSVERADKVLSEYTDLKTVEERIEYLLEMFDNISVKHEYGGGKKTTYTAILSAIVSLKIH